MLTEEESGKISEKLKILEIRPKLWSFSTRPSALLVSIFSVKDTRRENAAVTASIIMGTDT